jgi:hypothetical protein
MSFHVIYEDPSYEPVEADFYYDLDDKGNWVEVHVDEDGNPIPEPHSPFATINS